MCKGTTNVSQNTKKMMLYEIKIVILIALSVLRVYSLFTLVTKQAIELLH